MLENPPYSPNLSPCDFQVLRSLKRIACFCLNDDVKEVGQDFQKSTTLFLGRRQTSVAETMGPEKQHPVDEAHFWLNGYIDKQNCRIWSEANPQVYVETPLHPEKLTVWCALWAGGILLQKR
ncbi:hypothetical protein TNCV_2817851 [Trichonephila clavipes]|nr:hypothetical protein TNCV_2817851 [Trichonephila clavipes]